MEREDDWTPLSEQVQTPRLRRPARADGRRIAARFAAHWDGERHRQPPARPAPRLGRWRGRAEVLAPRIEVGREGRGGEARERGGTSHTAPRQLTAGSWRSMPAGSDWTRRTGARASLARLRVVRMSFCLRGARPKARALQEEGGGQGRGRDDNSLLFLGAEDDTKRTAPAGEQNRRVWKDYDKGEMRERVGGEPRLRGWGHGRLARRSAPFKGDVSFDPPSLSRSGEHVVVARRARASS